MIDEVREFNKELVSVLRDAERLCFATRAKELQIEAIDQLQSLKAKAKELKAKIIDKGIEDLANRMLSYEQTLQALANELRMWVALKDDIPDEAWDALVKAETSARIALQSHESASHLRDYVERLGMLEGLLFPPITFISAGVLVKHSTCSICGADYGDCDHLKGKVYMGELCQQEIREREYLEASIVPKPANKHCRITSFTNKGVTRDVLTWRVISTGEERDNDRTAEVIFSTENEANL